MRYPKISIVTPSFNCKNLIADTLHSVLDQGYPNLEYIVIDGASTDGTAQIIEQFSPQLSYWQTQQDAGQYDAINQGFSKSTGEILCWLNADDMLLPRSLFVVGEIFSQLKEVEWLSSLQPASWDANGYLAQISPLPGFSKQAFLDGLFLPTTAKKGYWLQQESTFWRRSLWEKVGSTIPPYDLAGDFGLWCRFYEHAHLYGTSYPLGGFRMIQGQRSEDHQGYMVEANNALAKMRSKFDWRSHFTDQLLYSPFAKLPYIGNSLKNLCGYEGRFIQNSNVRLRGSSWEVVLKQFLP